MSEQYKAKVVIGKTVQLAGTNPQKLMKRAEAVASALTVPSGVEFVRFEHDGRTYALSARVIVEVEALNFRVPDVVIRQGELRRGKASERDRGRKR